MNQQSRRNPVVDSVPLLGWTHLCSQPTMSRLENLPGRTALIRMMMEPEGMNWLGVFCT